MTDHTRRRFLGVAAGAAASAFVAPTAAAAPGALLRPSSLPAAAGRSLAAATPVLADSPLPVGPGAPFGAYQSEIYIAGMSTGVKPIFTTNLSDLEAVASRVLSERARRHLITEAGGRSAARANRRAMASMRIVPRMFIDRSERDLSTTVLGAAMPAPVILGPVARQALASDQAEIGSALAAAALGLTYTHSSRASLPVEAVAAATPAAPRWFGLSWPGDSGADPAELMRAQAAGCTHLVLSPPQPGQSWRPLGAIRRAWDGPIILNGVQTVRDARIAQRRGLDGVVVSNERGRRGPGSGGTIRVLPEIADAVGGRLAVLLGSGVRTGTDVFRSLALGADAVLLGRPYVYGLALADEEGVRHMLRTLLAELEIDLAIAGVKSLRGLDESAIVRSPAP